MACAPEVAIPTTPLSPCSGVSAGAELDAFAANRVKTLMDTYNKQFQVRAMTELRFTSFINVWCFVATQCARKRSYLSSDRRLTFARVPLNPYRRINVCTQTYKDITTQELRATDGGVLKHRELRKVPEKPKLANKVVFVLGGPGSGKGTQCAKLVEDYGFTHLSAGDLLRAEVKSQSETGQLCAKLMKEGKLVPMEVTIGLLKAAMEKAETKNFLIDGFPRALDQALAFEEQVTAADFVLFFDCPLETMTERLLERGKSSGRADDNADTIRKRFDTFTNESLPVLDHYKREGMAHVISSVPSPHDVYVDVMNAMYKEKVHPTPVAEKVIFVLGGPGSGKGTQCDKLVKDYALTHLSSGDLLRAEVKARSEIGVMCASLIKDGKLVPNELTLQLIKNAMKKSENKSFLIDGFPRSLDQATSFAATIQEPDFVLFFDCPLETMTERLLERGLTSGRSDDNEETIRKRFDTFSNQSLPVLDFYKEKGIANVISSVPTPDAVYNEVINTMICNGMKPKPVADKIVFVLGGPGSGKGTQCAKLVEDYGFTHLSAGDLLRDEVRSQSETGQMCAQLMKEGKLVPMEVTIGLLKAAMEKAETKNFLIDGFPRALDQGRSFEDRVQPADFVLFFDCPLETMTERLLERGLTSGRSDDNMETIRKRFDTFTSQSLPVLDAYMERGTANVISSVPSPDEVYSEVISVMAKNGIKPKPVADKIVFVLGGPGSGKGTQCAKLVEDYGFTHLSAGDLLRDEVRSRSEVGTMCAQLMKEGKLVPMEVTIGLLKAAMEKAETKNFLIDGFPRALDQAMAFEERVQSADFVLFFDCPLETMTERLLERGLTGGRSDDNMETIRKRFDTFTSQSLPVLDYYQDQGNAHVISATAAPDSVYADVRAAMTQNQVKPKPVADKIVFVLGGPGSGKGTQCAKLVEDYGFTHLSAGDLLRDEVRSQSETGQMCAQLMKEGKLVPMEVTIGLLKAAMEKAETKNFLIDGFPRALDQGLAFSALVQEPNFVLFFDCPLETMTERLLERGKTSGRADDNADTIRKRFDTFTTKSLPVLEYYKDMGIANIVSAVPPPDEVYVAVRGIMSAHGVAGGPAVGVGMEVVDSLVKVSITAN